MGTREMWAREWGMGSGEWGVGKVGDKEGHSRYINI